MALGHIVKSYDEDLKHLNNQLFKMADMTVEQLGKAIEAMVTADSSLAQEVIVRDPEIDALEHDIDTFAVRMIALRQPVAQDLRSILTALKVSSHLERIADYAANIARRAINLKDLQGVQSVTPLKRMIEISQEMIKEVISAYIGLDVEKAMMVWQRDHEVDEMYNSYFRELLTYMMEDPRNISACTQLLFAAKNIERVGDQATNIAEMVYYLVHGTPPAGFRSILTPEV
jgi:phosphate transport system protein